MQRCQLPVPPVTSTLSPWPNSSAIIQLSLELATPVPRPLDQQYIDYIPSGENSIALSKTPHSSHGQTSRL